MHMNRYPAFVYVFLLLSSANPAFAYVGPGAGLSALGSILAFLGVIALIILGFVWYPMKRMVGRYRGQPDPDAVDPQDTK